MSVLSTKINSYAIDNGIEFNSAYALPPVQTGANDNQNSAYWSLSGRVPVFESTVGPKNGAGSWKFVSDANNSCRVRNTGSYPVTAVNDGDYSAGIWVKINQVPNFNDFFFNIHTHLAVATVGYAFNVAAAPGTQTPYWTLSGSASTYSTPNPLNLNQWYYIAVTRIGNQVTFYIDGVQVLQQTSTKSTNSSAVNWGGINPVSSGTMSYNLSNYYIAPTSQIGATQIAEIYLAGAGGTDITQTATPMTADASFVDVSVRGDSSYTTESQTATGEFKNPTIVIVNADSINVTTSFAASSQFVDASVQTSINVSNAQTVWTASAEMEQHTVIVGSDLNITVEPATASTTMPGGTPVVAYLTPALTASAFMISPVIQLTPSYKNLVMGRSPVVYLKFDSATPVNYGSAGSLGPLADNNIFDTDFYVSGANNPGFPLKTVDEGKYLDGSNVPGGGLGDAWGYATQNSMLEISDTIKSRNFAIEFWYKQPGNEYTFAPDYNGHPLISTLPFTFKTMDMWATNPTISYEEESNQESRMGMLFRQGSNYTIDQDGNYIPDPNNPPGEDKLVSWDPNSEGITNYIEAGKWNHYVINCYPHPGGLVNNVYVPPLNGEMTVEFYINGVKKNLKTVGPQLYFPPQGQSYYQKNNGEGSMGNFNTIVWENPASVVDFRIYLNYDQGSMDELAIYPRPLTASEIIDDYTYVANTSSDRDYDAQPMIMTGVFAPAQFLAIQNVYIENIQMTASALFASPTVVASQNINYSVSAFTATSSMYEPEFYGNPDVLIQSSLLSATAYGTGHTHIDTTYEDYFKSNMNPYHFISFDHANPVQDDGTDNQYGSAPSVLLGSGRTITDASIGINNKSVLTDSGIVVYESEYNDAWGSDTNSYNVSFWMQLSENDASASGVKILANLHSEYNGHYILVYHYQNKIMLEVFDPIHSASIFKQQTVSDYDIFDGTRKFFFIQHHNSGSHQEVRIYLNATLVMTADVGTRDPLFLNGTTYVEPNNALNNKPRLGIGTLITPYGSTGLLSPVRQYEAYFDNIGFAKNNPSQTIITNIYNRIVKTSTEFNATVLTASLLMTTPSLSLSVTNVATPMTVDANIVNPAVSTQLYISISADPSTANTTMPGGLFTNPTQIYADPIFVSAVFPDIVVKIAARGETAYASAILPESGIMINGFTIDKVLAPWVRYLRATDVSLINPMIEVK